MSDTINLIIDGREIQGKKGQTILEAAEAAGIYIPRLCHLKGLVPFGSCRVCTVLVNGRPQAACTQPIAEGIVVENDSEKVAKVRRDIIDMLFVEGNHYCMFCEKSGNCELQAMAYRFGILSPRFPYMFPKRDVDASHPDILVDHNRCILCARCVRASHDVDGKNAFQFIRRGIHKKVGVDAEAGLGGTDLKVSDRADEVCPVGAIIKKRTGYAVPIGKRLYDHKPIGTEIEAPQSSCSNK